MSVRVKATQQAGFDTNKAREWVRTISDDPKERLQSLRNIMRGQRKGHRAIKKMEQRKKDEQIGETNYNTNLGENSTNDTTSSQSSSKRNRMRNRTKRKRQQLKELEKKVGTITEERYMEALERIRAKDTISKDTVNYEQKIVDLYNKQNVSQKNVTIDWEKEFDFE